MTGDWNSGKMNLLADFLKVDDARAEQRRMTASGVQSSPSKCLGHESNVNFWMSAQSPNSNDSVGGRGPINRPFTRTPRSPPLKPNCFISSWPSTLLSPCNQCVNLFKHSPSYVQIVVFTRAPASYVSLCNNFLIAFRSALPNASSTSCVNLDRWSELEIKAIRACVADSSKNSTVLKRKVRPCSVSRSEKTQSDTVTGTDFFPVGVK